MSDNPFISFETFLFDGDGVLYKESEPLPGAIEFLNFLNEKKKQIYILTNNSTKTRKEFQTKLTKLGISINIENIMTSSSLTANYIARESPKSRIYVIGEDGLKNELKSAGLEVLNDWQEKNDDKIFDFNFDDVDYIITGMDRFINYTKISRATHILLNYDKVKFIATNADFTFPTVQGLIPGGGAMIKILEELSSRRVEQIIGKPEPEMYETAVKLSNTPKDKTIMFGDRLETDILGANRIGMSTCLVLTGVTSMTDLENLTDEDAPTIIVNDLQDALRSFTKS